MKGFTLWFTGPNRSDRNYLARMVEESLLERGIKVEMIAEEASGMTLFQGLGDSSDGREAAAERAAYVSQLLARNDVIAIVSVDCPFNGVRGAAREALERFCEVYVKGATAGFEEPARPEVLVTMEEGEDQCVSAILKTLEVLKLIPADEASGDYSGDEEAKITKRLKDLGYI